MILKYKMIVSGLAVISSACFGIYYGSMKWLKMNKQYMTSHKINNPSRQIRILHISDLHANSSRKKNLDIWKDIKKIEFDLVVITGDVVITWLNEIHSHLQEIKALAQIYPVFFVDGNHESFFEDDMAELLTGVGVDVLYNKCVEREINHCKINIIGIRDYYFLKANRFEGVDELFQNFNPEYFTLVLSHQPQIFDKIKKYKPDLVLCGHTHGGQVRLPFFPTLFAPGQGFLPKYGRGWYRFGRSLMYISQGIGTTIFPIRFFNRPEIAVIHVQNDLS